MLVADLRHLLDLPEDAPGSARRLAEHLSGVVRAATAGDASTAWETALPCRRRPGNRACPGRMIVHRVEPPTAIRWQCRFCDDAGVISNWEDSPFDLRRRHLAVAKDTVEFVIPVEVAATLRGLLVLDPECERLVFRIRAHPDGAVLAASIDDLEELIESVASEANNEPNRRRQQRFDTAFEVLNEAARSGR
jgi:hypothetical protein